MQQMSYLESKVMTATPQRLHLMLIEGAIRFGRLAETALKNDERVAAAAALARVIDIVGEMLAGVRENKTELNKRLTDVYWYIFRRVSEAKIQSDANILREALQLLEYERHTWLLVCEKFGGATSASVPPPPLSRSFDRTSAQGAKANVSWQA
jgi:flagellar secretion chaperone FliS